MRLYSPRRKKKSASFGNEENNKLHSLSIDKNHCGTTLCDTSCDSSSSSRTFSLPRSSKHRPTRGLSSESRGSAGLGRFLQNYDSMMDSLSSMSFDSSKLFPDRVPEKISPSRHHRRSTKQHCSQGLERSISSKAVCLQIDLPKRTKGSRDLERTSSAETVTMQFDTCFERSSSFSSLEDSIQLERKKSCCVRTKSSSLGHRLQGTPQDPLACHAKPTQKPVEKTQAPSLEDLFNPDFDCWQEETPGRRPAVRRNSSSSLGDLLQNKAPRKSCARSSSSSLGDLFQAAPRDFDSW